MRKIISVVLAIAILVTLTVIPSFAASNNGNVASKSSEDLIKNSSTSSEKPVASSQLTGQNEIDEAYQRVDNEEKYIASLIVTLSKKETTTSNWEYNLKFLKDNYKDIQKKSKSLNINMNYVNSYIEAYEMVLLMKNSPAEKTPSATVSASATFDFTKAVNYANTYYSNYNTAAYPDWTSYGGDCANFISQCLYAGGMPMKGTPGTASEAQNFANWFSKGNTCDTLNVSSTWRGADAFRNYWQSNAVGYKTFSSYSSSAYSYGYRGYAVSLLNSNGRAYHTLIIVDYNSTTQDLIYAAHTGNTNTGSLKSASSGGYGFIIYATW